MSNPILKIPKEQLSGVETPCCQFAHLLTHHFVWNMVILADQLINLSEFGMCCLINITDSTWNFPPQKKHTNIFSYFNLSPTKKKKEHCGFFSPKPNKTPTTLEAPFNTGKRNKERLISPVLNQGRGFLGWRPLLLGERLSPNVFWCQNLG